MAKRDEAEQVRARVRRYAQLRAAERAIMGCGRFHECVVASKRASDVLGRLRAGLEQLSVATHDLTQELGNVDGTLVAYCGNLLTIMGHTPIPSYRAGLPTAVVVDRSAVVGLLDLCLESQETTLANIDLIDYVTTLLSCKIENGLQRLNSDPVRASRRLASVCAMVERKLGGGADMEERINAATESLLDLADMDEAVKRVRGLKAELGTRFFLPRVLRALVNYNIAIGSRVQELLDQERAMDKEFLAGLDA